jgi:uncharacterized protein YjdB
MKKNLLFGFIASLALSMSISACNQVSAPKGDSYEDKNVLSVTLTFETYDFSNVGETVQLEATIETKDGTPFGGEVTWRSSAPSIATVTDGLVTAISGGECYITAQAGYKVGKCKVNVPKSLEPVGTFILSQTSVSLKPNTSSQLHGYQNGTEVTGIVWDSSNPAVATIDNGLITALSEGTSIITATYNSQTAKCTVTVSEDVVVEFSIRLDRSSAEVLEGGSTTLKAITSEEAEVSWTSSDSTIATVNNGVVTGVKAGSAVITATANGKSATCNVTVNEGDDEDKCVLVRFYRDCNNVDPNDPDKMLAEFMWYQNVPLKTSTDVPANPTLKPYQDQAFPYFIGWSTHTLIDSKDDLWNMDTDCVDGTVYTLTLYGIWLDVEVMTA